MSETILCLIPSSLDGSFDKHALECLTAAEQLKSALSAQLVVGTWGSAQPDPSIGSIGASAYLHVDGDAFNQARYATDSAAAEAIAKQCGATVIIAPANSRIQRILSGVAQRMGGTVDTHATGIEAESGKIIVSRWYYRQRMLAKLVRSARPCFVSVESGCFPVHTANGSCSFQKISVPAGSRTTVKDVLSSTGGDQTIRPDAELLFVAGAGWTKKQADGTLQHKKAEDLILSFINKRKASLGSSKSMVDLSSEGQEVLSFLTHMHQIGQTGATPRHSKGLSTCCHGEEPHAVGWRFVQERRAINLDPNCGWAHGKADVLYVADAFQVMERINAKL